VSFAVTAGAVVAHLTVLGVETPMSAAPEAEQSPMLFAMALVFLAVSLLLVVLSRPRQAAAT
jgi:hypothetical protein